MVVNEELEWAGISVRHLFRNDGAIEMKLELEGENNGCCYAQSSAVSFARQVEQYVIGQVQR